MSNLHPSHTILLQLGGTGRLNMMTGAKNFMKTDSGVQFNIGRNAKSVNMVRVTLNGNDLYDVEFGRVRKVKGVPTYKVLNKHADVYNDMLVELFESNTGMYLTF
jgi:hypothetical protein